MVEGMDKPQHQTETKDTKVNSEGGWFKYVFYVVLACGGGYYFYHIMLKQN